MKRRSTISIVMAAVVSIAILTACAEAEDPDLDIPPAEETSTVETSSTDDPSGEPTVTPAHPEFIDETCEECHDYRHIGSTYADIPCVDCHELIVWEDVSYTHDLVTMDTGFHDFFSCSVCHLDEETPPPPNCFDCHPRSPHEGPDSCDACHTPHSWGLVALPAGHRTLEGVHATVDCLACHDVSLAAPSTCVGCHGVRHGGLVACEKCHTQRGFSPSTFSHSRAYELVGRHATVSCSRCHSRLRYAQVAGTECADCHGVAHGGLSACDRCHTPAGFAASTFDHSSAYTLLGQHAAADCAGCHPSNRYAEVRGTRCTQCHGVYHADRTDCEQCHTPVGWVLSSAFVHSARFNLSGLHLAVPCYECHPGNEFSRPLPRACDGCHSAPHIGPTNCIACHRTVGWSQLRFSHVPMKYHAGLGVNEVCASCHTVGNYAAYTCGVCHDDGRRYDSVEDL